MAGIRLGGCPDCSESLMCESATMFVFLSVANESKRQPTPIYIDFFAVSEYRYK